MEEVIEHRPALIDRTLSVALRVLTRLISPFGWKLVTPAVGVLLTYALWRLWRAASGSALGRALRWHAAFLILALIAGSAVFVVGAPPEDRSDAAEARFAALERAGRPVYTTPIVAAGGLAVAVSTFVGLRSLWLIRVPALDQGEARDEWRRFRARHSKRVALALLATLGGGVVLGAGALGVGSVSPASLPGNAARGLWIGTPRGATHASDGAWESLRRPWAALPASQVTDIAAGPTGEVWIATNGGLLRRAPNGESLAALVENAPLPYPTVLGVAVDARGVAWAATVAGAAGVDGLRNGRAFNGRTAPLMHQLLDAAAVDHEGRVWFGGAGGVNVYEPPATWSEPGRWPAGFNRYLTDDGLPNNLVFTIFEDSRGRMWFGTDGGAAAFTPEATAYSLGSADRARWLTLSARTSPLANEKTHAIAEDRQGRIYLGTEAGVSVLDESAPPDRRWSTIGPARLPHAHVEALLAAPDGRIWIGTKGGLTVYDPGAPAAPLPVYRANGLRYWTGLFWAPHARQDVLADEITALAWSS